MNRSVPAAQKMILLLVLNFDATRGHLPPWCGEVSLIEASGGSANEDPNS